MCKKYICVEVHVIDYSMCVLQPSVFELVRRPDFANLPLVVEDFVKDSGGSYTGELTCRAETDLVNTFNFL